MRLERCAASQLLESTLRAGAFRPRVQAQCLFHLRRSSSSLLTRQRRIPPLLSATSSLVPSSQCTHQHRYTSTSTTPYPPKIAILGGGIAGLSSAYFISREFPKSKVTIFEAGKETGGWIRSKRVAVDGGDVLFELGPRTLRNATVTASLIQDLGLIDDVIFTKRSEPGAKNRFIYFPDRLNRLPAEPPSLSDLFALWRSGILGGVLGMIKEPLMPKRPDSMSDETVGSFLARRVDKRIANNIVSAVFHGIYAGDIWQLSAKTLLNTPWQLEGRYGSALGGFFRMQSEDQRPQSVSLVHPYDLDMVKATNEEIDLDPEFVKNLKEAAMFTFKDGLQHLVRALQNAVETKGNVVVTTESPIQSFTPIESEAGPGVEVVSGNEGSTQTETFDLVVSTLRNNDLTPYVTVMTVNLYFPDPKLLPVEGFGYLIPQSIPFEQNPERALGVIFDSSAIRGQDNLPAPGGGTKLTVMLGGHWWDNWESYPSEEEGLEMARAVLKRHLNITAEPLAHCVNLARDAIPQYTLGYEDRARDFADGIESEFKGRLRVVGSQVNGVGVNDCVAGAWAVARG
ncbi:oxygen-dependent protoporphyrinogen oxidase [Neocucurbitaria cava]|uniref:Protoporphyrinogen oxidase n=1 Tax=Neocucurbitaria cava TaxID=798079 RepID=A0A9W8YH62_9PLEO|nr:oxygen-dependent protoporphyrinogen oxidase [Neocucurbitaria cava]